MKPENCHYHLGTCREPGWGEANCMIPHTVYLALTSEVKIGITRHSQIPTRWLDQGATQALPIFEVQTRRQSGYVEEVFKNFLSDRTNWRQLLKGDQTPVSLNDHFVELIPKIKDRLEELKSFFGEGQIQVLETERAFEFKYPVVEYPSKIKSLSFDKQELIEGTLMGIKGQYLILDCGVINLRKHTGYEVEISY